MRKNKLALAIQNSLFTALVTTSSAYAQQDNIQSLPEEDTQRIEKIMVTGNKIARSLQETTTSVAVLTADQLEKKNINTFVDSLTETANAFALPGGKFSIRGIDGFNVSGSGTSFLASVYVDGAPLPQRMIQGGAFSTWDARQVEILRGPQSTLQGRNALAGAVILTSNEATFDWQGQYRVQAGELGERELGFAVGGGLVDDWLAFRVSAETKDIDGHIYNSTRHEYADYRDDDTYRAKILLAPDSVPEFYAQLTYTHTRSLRGSEPLQIAEGENPFNNKTVQYNDLREQFSNGDLVSLEVNYDIDDFLTFSSFTTWSDTDSGFTWDSDYIGDTGTDFPDDTGGLLLLEHLSNTLTQELRVTFDYDDFSGVAGLFYYDYQQDSKNEGLSSYALSRLGLTSTYLQYAYGLDTSIADLVIAEYAGFDPAQVSQVSIINIETESYAAFADAVWHINDKWDIYGGFRWDHEQQYFNSEGIYTISNVDKLPSGDQYAGTPYAGVTQIIAGLNAYLMSVADAASQPSTPGDASFSDLLPKLGVSYRWSDDIVTSFTVQEGYRSGGVSVNSGQSYVYDYDSESTVNYEFSFRSAWLNDHLTLNANVFYIDWTDQQVSVQLSNNTYDRETQNAGSSEVKGFEVELNYMINNEWNVYTSTGHSKTRFIDFIVEVPTENEIIVYDLSGRRFADSPEWTANAGVTYNADSGWYANANINYADNAPTSVNPYTSSYNEGEYGFDMYNDGRTLINAKLGYRWDDFGLYIIGKNLTNEEYITSASVRSPILGYPRQFSVSLRGSF